MPGWFWVQPALSRGRGSTQEPSHPKLTQKPQAFKGNGPTQRRGPRGTQAPGPPHADISPSILPLAGSGDGPWPPSLGKGSLSPWDGARDSDPGMGAAPQLGAPHCWPPQLLPK